MEKEKSCRADARPFASHRMVPISLAFLFIVVFTGCSLYMQRNSVAARYAEAKAEYGIWTSVFAAVAGYAAASVVYGWCFHRGILRISGRHGLRDVARWFSQVIVAGGVMHGALAFSAGRTAPGVEREMQRLTVPLIIGISILAIPALAGFLALRAVALDDSSWTEGDGCRMKLLIRLRAECQRLLVVFSIFLTLLVIATGLRRRALLAIKVMTPAEGVLLYGLVYATLLALFYLAAARAIDFRCQEFLQQHADLPEPSDPHLSAAVSRRKDLASVIGLGGSWSTFATVVVVAFPLLTALLAGVAGK